MPRGPVRARGVVGRGRNPVAWITLILAVLGAVGVGTFVWMRKGDAPFSGRVVSEMGVSNSPAPTPSSNAVRTIVEPQRPVVALPPVATNRLIATNRIVNQVPPPLPGGAATGSPQGAQGIAGTNVPGIVPAPDTGLDDLSTVPDRAPTNILEAQIVLAGLGISSGSVDGVGGYQTGEALRAFQNSRGLEETGRLDNDTQELLRIVRPLFRRLVLKPSDFEGLAPVPDTWLGKSKATNLGFETVLESLAERSHSSPILLRKLNPGVEWSTLKPGQEVVVPNAVYPPARRAALARISLQRRHLRVFDADGDLIAHFPCSIGKIAEKRPVGELEVASLAKNPNYTFNPAVFPESEEARKLGRRLVLPAGPNNPVGVAWIGLSRPGYGIHGTPLPEMVGRTESHGCFRLANWNADYLRRMAWVGMPIWVEL